MDVVLLIISCVINLSLAIIVMTRSSKLRYAWWYFFLTISVCGWVVSNYLTNHAVDDLSLAANSNIFAYIFGYATVVFGLLFTYEFPVKRHVRSSVIPVLTGLMVVGTLLLSATPEVAGVVKQSEAGVGLVYEIGPAVWLYALAFVVTVGMIVRNLIDLPSHTQARVRRQARLILIAFVASALGGLMMGLVLPALGLGWDVTRLSPLASIILVGMIGYSIVRHGLFDIRLAAVRTVAYGLSVITMAILYFVLVYAASKTFVKDTGIVDSSPANVVLALLLALVFQPIKSFFDKTTDRIFFRDRYDTGEFISRLGGVLTSTTELQLMLDRASAEIGSTLKASFASFVIYRDDQPDVTTKNTLGLDDADHGALKQLFSQCGDETIVVDNMIVQYPEYAKTLSHLSYHRVALILPLNGQLGFLLLGEQRGSGYSQRDTRVLDALSDELVIAIQNARSVQAIQDLNATLQHRISEATRELRSSNKRLKELDKTKDEFISMASHQLRTPLTSVKGYISMVLEGDAGRVTSAQKKLLGEAFASSERMVHLIGDFLNVSRLQTGKFILERHESDLGELVQQEVDGMRQIAGMHGIALKFRKPRVFPLLYLDEGKLRQVIMNFIDNAIYYSPDSNTVSITATIEEGFAVVKVIDSGMGVPKDAQEKLFTKFFRAENARRQRPDGTGVGLYLAKKIIDEHGGSILFESRVDKGSTFGFRLPIKKLSLPPAEDTDNL